MTDSESESELYSPAPEQKEQKKKLDDEACGRLLEVYVQEAKQYDEGLVKSWKEDMDVTLVFSGLYSAVLTAFVIESYQRLQEDPVNTSVALLRQLVAISNSSDIVSAAQDEFMPTPAAVACNILWFSSLILALCCAFLATFVQQWSRQFLHKTGLLRSSTAHARLFSFLYFGLKDFQMHTVVNVIPSMLHLSLFLFLGGLIAFLRDVSPALTYIVVGALAIVTLIYFAFTILPLLAPPSPYQTPLSPIAWQIWNTFTSTGVPFAEILLEKLKAAFRRFRTPWAPLYPVLPTFRLPRQLPSIWKRVISSTPPISRHFLRFLEQITISFTSCYNALRNYLASTPAAATVNLNPEKKPHSLSTHVLRASQMDNRDRDAQAISWTLSSLTNDQELLLFVEALPDAIYGPDFIIRDNNLHLIKALVETTDPQRDIILRITSLITNASNSWFDKNHRDRCAIACPKALWFLAYMFVERGGQFDLAKASREFWFPEHILDALDKCGQSTTGDTPGRKYAISAGVLCAFGYGITNDSAGAVISQFLNTSGELEPFEFERTCRALSEYLSREIVSDKEFSESALYGRLMVPQIPYKDLLLPGQIARLDVVVGLCLQLPKLHSSDAEKVLQYIYQRAEMDGWGSTKIIWDDCESPRALGACNVSRNFCNAMREYIYTLSLRQLRTQDIEPLLLACVRKLVEHSANAGDKNSDTSQIALETMIAMRVVLVDAPEEGAEGSKDFEEVRQYVEQNVLRLGAKSWTWDDPRYGENVNVGRVVTLTTRLLEDFQSSADDPVATNDILDALEFILFIGYRDDLFTWHLRAFGEDLLHIFSKISLDVCQWWTEKPSESVSRNTLEIIAWMWYVWRNFELPQSEKATRNLAKAAKLMLSPELVGKVEECKSKEASRVPAPHKGIAQYLDGWLFEWRFDLEEVLDRYKGLQKDDQSVHSRGLTAPFGVPYHPRLSTIVEEGPDINEDGDGNNNLSSSILQGPSSLPLPDDLWVI